MSRLDQAPEIVALAEDLGLDGLGSPVEAIIGFCLASVDSWLGHAGGVTDIEQLQALVIEKLQMVFEEVWSDADFDRIKAKYAKDKKDAVFASLLMRFDDTTFGVLIRRKTAVRDAPDRYVAVIDCRGEKATRRFFTRWHEIGHRLTLVDELDEPVFRSEKDPIERMMDEIAGRVGFYEPFLRPALEEQLQRTELLTFEIVEAIRCLRFAAASFQATLSACNRLLPTPLIYLEAAHAHKAGEQREIDRGQCVMFEEYRPVAKLRAVLVVPNPAAQSAGFHIAPNMRIPQTSIVHRLFVDGGGRDAACSENLNTWEHSGGKRLPDQKVWIEARRIKDRVFAIVQPIDDNQRS